MQPEVALFTLVPPPCEGCKFSARCAAEELACEAFGLYAACEGQQRWRAAPRAPTRGRFLAIFGAPEKRAA